MKFYDCTTAPSPRRVRIFMAEKGIELPTVQVDLRNREQFSEAFLKINPWASVPALELDDGTVIAETEAVMRYLEEAYPEPPLWGVDAKDKAVVEMWEHRIEYYGYYPISEILRNTAERLENRAMVGPFDHAQIPELAERGRLQAANFFTVLEAQAAENEFVAGPRYTVADITALIAVDFAQRLKIDIPDELKNARRWYEAVNARPSASA